MIKTLVSYIRVEGGQNLVHSLWGAANFQHTNAEGGKIYGPPYMNT